MKKKNIKLIVKRNKFNIYIEKKMGVMLRLNQLKNITSGIEVMANLKGLKGLEQTISI